MVDDTQSTKKGNVDGHVVLSDRVHGRRDEGSLEGDALGDGGVEGDIDSGKAYRQVRMP